MFCGPENPTISRDRLSTNETNEKENFDDWYIINVIVIYMITHTSSLFVNCVTLVCIFCVRRNQSLLSKPCFIRQILYSPFARKI